MSIVENVIKKIENKRSREKPRKDRKREEEVWELENWLIGTDNVRRRKSK